MIEDVVKALKLVRENSLVKYCWINEGDDEEKKVAEMQKEFPFNNVVSIGWDIACQDTAVFPLTDV